MCAIKNAGHSNKTVAVRRLLKIFQKNGIKKTMKCV